MDNTYTTSHLHRFLYFKKKNTPLPLVSCSFLGTSIKLIYETFILTIRDSVINNANTIKNAES